MACEQEPGVTWAYGAVYTVMNNRDQIDTLYPDKFTADDNNNGPAEVMFRAPSRAGISATPSASSIIACRRMLTNPEYGGDGKGSSRCGATSTIRLPPLTRRIGRRWM